jgi:hypothetical protein
VDTKSTLVSALHNSYVHQHADEKRIKNDKQQRGLTSLPSVLSKSTTRPPRSPVAKCSPLLSNSIAEIMSTGRSNTEEYQQIGAGTKLWIQVQIWTAQVLLCCTINYSDFIVHILKGSRETIQTSERNITCLGIPNASGKARNSEEDSGKNQPRHAHKSAPKLHKNFWYELQYNSIVTCIVLRTQMV